MNKLVRPQLPAPPAAQPLSDEVVNVAAVALADVMDCPWQEMHEEGRQKMRNNAKYILESVDGITKEQS